jgi:hypothetical protein
MVNKETVTVNDELSRMPKEVVVADFNAVFQNFSGGTDEDYEELQSAESY